MGSLPGTAVTASSPQPVDRRVVPWRFPTGEWAYLAGNWRVFLAALIDAVPVLGAGAIQYLAVMNSMTGTTAQAVASAILVSAVVAFAYGCACFSGHTLGTLACGTRLVKLRDASAPGMLRGGWLMLVRTVIGVYCPLAPALFSVNANGKNVPLARRFHISIRKIPVRGSAAENTAAFGETNERFAPPEPVSKPAIAPMDGYHPLVPSQFKDGTLGVQPQLRRILLAWFLDLIFVGSIAAMLSSGAASTADFVGILVFLLVPLSWIYGFCCASGNSIGTLFVGTRIVRLRNAKAPGFWRGGWIMFYRIILFWAPPVLIVCGYFGGMSNEGDMLRALHVSIDKRRTAALRSA